MASLLKSVAVTCVSAVPIAASSSSALAVHPVSGCQISSARLLEFRGLKIRLSSVTWSLGQRLGLARGGRVFCQAQETVVKVSAVSDSTWQSLVLESESPVLVEFWAPWCGPCRMIQPIVDELAKEYAGRFKFYKVNTDESPVIANQYGIRSIPTVIIFKKGEKKDTVIGAVPRTTLEASMEKLL